MAEATVQPNIPRLSLYVGDLMPDVTEVELFNTFSTVGQVQSVRICRNSSQACRGYGYVNYSCTEDAEKALHTLNFQLMRGIPMRIMWSQRDSNLRKLTTTNIFIKNLDKSIDSRMLHDTFSAFGNILSCKVALDHNHTSKGYGFINFETMEAADQAIEKVNGMLIKEKIVRVEHYISRAERLERLAGAEIPFFNIYLKNFSENLTEQDLMEKFKVVGNISSLAIVKDVNGNSRGFGFIAFEDFTSAKNAISQFNGVELTEGKRLYVCQALTKIQRQQELKRKFVEFKEEINRQHQGCNLYVKHLNSTMDDSGLHQEFCKFGTITSAKVMKANNRSRGFGFVCFSNAEEASKALIEMNGRIIDSKPLYVSLAERKEVRRAQLRFNIEAFQRFNALPHAANNYESYQNGGIGYSGPPNLSQQVVSYPMSNPLLQPISYYPAPLPVNFNGIRFPVNQNHPTHHQNRRPNNRTKNTRNAQAPPRMSIKDLPHVSTTTVQEIGIRPSMNQNHITHKDYRKPNNRRRNMRNAPQTIPVATIPQAPPSMSLKDFPRIKMVTAQDVTMTSQVPETSSISRYSFAAASTEERSKILGERLYPVVSAIYPELAPKITGMILELPSSEVIGLLENSNSLKDKIKEAFTLLKTHKTQQE